MGEVVMIYKIAPDGAEVDIDQLKEKVKNVIPEKAKVQTFDVVPLAFGIKALKLNFLINDREGGTDDFEEKVEAIEGVGSIELEEMGLA